MGKIESLFPFCGSKKKRDRRKWYGWLNTIKSVDALMRPGLLIFWENLSDRRRAEIRTYVRTHLGGEGAWKKVSDYKRALVLSRREKGKIGRKSPAALSAINEVLSDRVDVVVTLESDSLLIKEILLLRSAGVSAEGIAEKFSIDQQEVNTIATKKALAAMRGLDMESLVTDSAFLSVLLNLLRVISEEGESFSIKEWVNVGRFFQGLQDREYERSKSPQVVKDFTDQVRKMVEDRQRMYLDENPDT